MGKIISKEYDENTQTLITTEQEEFINRRTGEIVTVDNIKKTIYGQKNFWKCYLMDFLSALGIIDNKQLDIFIYICENTNQSTNLFIGTYSKIAEDVQCSRATIAKIMKKLQAHGFIKKIQNGVWFVNPNILMKGNDQKRQILLSYFQADEPINQITYSRTKQKELKADTDSVVAAIPERTIKQGVLPAIEEGEEQNDDSGC